jgi:hypothetical protein
VKPAHIYRRRRLGAVLFAAFVVSGLYTGTRAGAEQSSLCHSVTPGETLWLIATNYYPPSEDPRVAIEEIRQANDLEGYRIDSGECLELP